MTSQLFRVNELFTFDLSCGECGVGTSIKVSKNDSRDGTVSDARKWKPKHCPECGKKIVAKVEQVEGL